MAAEISQVDVEIRRIEFHTHQKQIRTFIGVFVGVQDVSIVAINEVGNRRHNTFLIGTAEQKNGGAFRHVLGCHESTRFISSKLLGFHALRSPPSRRSTPRLGGFPIRTNTDF